MDHRGRGRRWHYCAVSVARPERPQGLHPDRRALGIAGAFLATFLGQALGWYRPDQGAGFITATIGALVVLFIWNRLVVSGRIGDPGVGPRM